MKTIDKTVEGLLKPRYKVIADYPQSIWKVGESLPEFPPTWCAENLDKFPKIFRKLEWYEERKEEDMPDYLKRIKFAELLSWHNIELNEVVEVSKWIYQEKIGLCFFTKTEDNSQLNYDLSCFVPATYEEYLQYNNQLPEQSK